MEKSKYDEQAEKFLKETSTTFKAEFLKNGLHFEDDKEPRDIYKITLIRGIESFSFNFGQSIVKSEDGESPNPYDVLSCLTTSDPIDFQEFCSEFGYDEDSKKAEKTFNAVVKEWDNVKGLWSGEEIEKLQEIQ